jgi:hypothetical protein
MVSFDVNEKSSPLEFHLSFQKKSIDSQISPGHYYLTYSQLIELLERVLQAILFPNSKPSRLSASK